MYYFLHTSVSALAWEQLAFLITSLTVFEHDVLQQAFLNVKL